MSRIHWFDQLRRYLGLLNHVLGLAQLQSLIDGVFPHLQWLHFYLSSLVPNFIAAYDLGGLLVVSSYQACVYLWIIVDQNPIEGRIHTSGS